MCPFPTDLPDGCNTALTLGSGAVSVFGMQWARMLGARGIIVGSRRMFVDLIQAMVTNDIRPVIDRVFDWDDVYDAIGYMQSGQKIGKIVIRVT